MVLYKLEYKEQYFVDRLAGVLNDTFQVHSDTILWRRRLEFEDRLHGVINECFPFRGSVEFLKPEIMITSFSIPVYNAEICIGVRLSNTSSVNLRLKFNVNPRTELFEFLFMEGAEYVK